MTTLTVGRRKVEISNPDKELFPGDGITKQRLAEYFRSVAEFLLPHVKDRPLAMERFPDGISNEGFIHKKVPEYFPDWIDRTTVRKEGGTVTHVVASDAATLVYLAGQASITLHTWLSRVDDVDHPDQIIFDLDPSKEKDFSGVKRAAKSLRDLLTDLGLEPFVKTTGSRGLHVLAPLARGATFDEVRDFTRDAAEVLVQDDPHLTVEHRKAKRAGRIFVDVMRNAYAQHAVAPYSPRPRPGAPVAAPLEWDELDHRGMSPERFTVNNVLTRLHERGDPWRNVRRHGRALSAPRQKLDALLDERVQSRNR